MRQDKKLSDALFNIDNVNINIQFNINSEATQRITSNRNSKEKRQKSQFFEKFKKMLVEFIAKIDVNVIIILSHLIFTLFK